MNYEVGLDPPKRDASEWPPFGMCSHALKSQESGFFTVVRRGHRKFIKRVAKSLVIDRALAIEVGSLRLWTVGLYWIFFIFKVQNFIYCTEKSLSNNL